MQIKTVAVLGAAGKMGSGISLVALKKLDAEVLLLDTSKERLEDLKGYLQEHEAPLDRARFVTSLEELASADLVFEAILEEIPLKTKVYSELAKVCQEHTFFLTNTSSIPISLLDEACGLNHRIIGFHFYNPPPVQKLVEVISANNTAPALKELASQLCEKLGKIEVPSSDVAGFIGNGHFIREILHACAVVEELSKERCVHEAIYLVNEITSSWMMRPMGIFQLVDYVGLDVVKNICKVMSDHIEGREFFHPLLDQITRLGGQNPDGSQKDGMFTYEKGRISEVYCPKNNCTYPIEASWLEALGERPCQELSWRSLRKSESKPEELQSYFSQLLASEGLGKELALRFLERSKQITEGLVADHVAKSEEDVAKVLKLGFAHLYSPSAPFSSCHHSK